MRVVWSARVLADLNRPHSFLVPFSERAADRNIAEQIHAAENLTANPRIGRRLESLPSHEVRRWIMRDYEIRYRVLTRSVQILRIWHGRENR